MAITKLTTPKLLDFPNNSTSSANTSGTVIPTGTTGFNVDCLVVAGGGGSGHYDSVFGTSGGGGGGGYLEITSKLLLANTAYTLTVGGGGTGGTSPTVNGTNGDNSVFDSIIAYGGGGGGSGQNVGVGGSDGASGGGGTGNSGTSPGGAGIAGQGNNGGDGEDSAGSDNSGGGGGAGSVGGAATSGSPGNGGAGTTTSLFNGALNIERAGGGGGANGNSTPGGTATGGGGAGGAVGSGLGTAGTPNTGGGGGGSYGVSNGADGGSGIVIIKYITTDVTSFSVTGTINTPTPIIDGSYSYLVFTSVGTGTLEFILSGNVRPNSNLNAGEFRFNTTMGYVEYYDGSKWYQIADEYITGQPSTCVCNFPTTATALYQFNDNVNDTCGNYNGTAFNLNSYVTGKFGKAASFNGTSSTINFGDSDVFSPSVNPLSFSLWIKTTNNTRYIYSKGSAGAYEYGLLVTASGKIELVAYNLSASSSVVITTSDSYNDGNWHHVVAIYLPNSLGSGNFKIYVDGEEKATSSTSLAMGNSSNALIFGKKFDVSAEYDGSIDQVRIFNTVLTPSQITELYNEVGCSGQTCTSSCNFPTGAGCQAYYQFNDNVEDTCDSYNGTPNNITYSPGQYKLAAVFNGSSSYVTTSYNQDDTAAFSWSCWMSITNVATAPNDNILGSMESGSPFNGVALFLDVDDIALSTNGNNIGNIVTNASTNTWYHIVVTYDGSGTFKTYAGGSIVSTISQTPVDGGNFWFGDGGPSSWNSFDGLLNRVRLYNTELTGAQVLELYNEPLCD